MLLILLIFIVHASIASRGDQSAFYQECVLQCDDACAHGKGPEVSIWNEALLWTCPNECRYVCMRQHVKLIRDEGGSTMQYHGKWPFIRILGVQELFSVVFSVGNLLAQIRGYKRFRNAIYDIRPKQYIFAPLVFMMFLSNCNGWIWSAIFHSRDFLFTERMDYFSAVWLILFSLFFSIIRTVQLKKYWVLAAVPFLAFYCMHVYFLHFVKFDYSYNMMVMAGCGVIFNAIWIVNGFIHRHNKKASHYRKAQLMGVLFLMAGVLEILDFAPIGDLIDAHALWHLATVPITTIWYQFLTEDVFYMATQSKHQ